MDHAYAAEGGPEIRGNGIWEIVDTYEDALVLIEEYETRTVTKFSVFRSNRSFGNIDVRSASHKVRWCDECYDFNGIPFIIAGVRILDCQYGRDRKRTFKEKRRMKKNESQDEDGVSDKTNIASSTKKLGCHAQIKMKEIFLFPLFKIATDSSFKKKSASKDVRHALLAGTAKETRKIFVFLPHISSHKNHGTGDKNGIDRRLISEIHASIGSARNVNGMRQLMNRVINKIFIDRTIPPKTNRSFFPSSKIIRSHMLDAIKEVRDSKIDEDCLIKKIAEWKVQLPDDHFFYQPKESTSVYTDDGWVDNNMNEEENDDRDEADVIPNLSSTNSLIFIYQSKNMKRLLSRYGNEMVLLDTTYKTIRFTLPLFLLVVKTNIDYQVVATFMCEGETADIIAFAIQKVKEWNPFWEPLYAMVDCCVEEIEAFERIFPNCKVYISDFHREQGWEKWLNDFHNGTRLIKDEMLRIFRKIALAQSEDELEEALNDLRNCEHWQNGYVNMVNWFQKRWLPLIERWCWFFLEDRFLMSVNVNNRIEKLIKSFKHSYLKKYHNSSLTSMMTILIEKYFVDSYESYYDVNTRNNSSYNRHCEDSSDFLQNRPQDFVKHCLDRMKLAKDSELTEITFNGLGRFSVQSITNSNERQYHLYFGDDMSNTMPSCTCNDWETTRYPCKHFFAVMERFPTISFYNFPSIYTDHVFLLLDTDVIPTYMDEPTTSPVISDDDNNLELDNVEVIGTNTNTNSQQFQEELKQIRDLTFLVNFDDNVYDRALPLLRSVTNILKNALPLPDELVLERTDNFAEEKGEEYSNVLQKRVNDVEQDHVISKGAKKAKVATKRSPTKVNQRKKKNVTY